MQYIYYKERKRMDFKKAGELIGVRFHAIRARNSDVSVDIAAMRELAALAMGLKLPIDAEARRAKMDRIIGQPAWIEERNKNKENQT